MPFLEQNTPTDKANDRRYVFWYNEIYFAGNEEEDLFHKDLVINSAKIMGIPLNEIEHDSRERPKVEAGGTITVIDGKLDFSVSTTTCNVIYSATEALKKVKARAREIVGAENVN